MMTRKDLKELLLDIAESDLAEGKRLQDHPCSVAISVLNNCFKEIDELTKLAATVANGNFNQSDVIAEAKRLSA